MTICSIYDAFKPLRNAKVKDQLLLPEGNRDFNGAKAFNLLYEVVMPDGSIKKDDLLLQHYDQPVSMCRAQADAMNIIRAQYPDGKRYDITEITRADDDKTTN